MNKNNFHLFSKMSSEARRVFWFSLSALIIGVAINLFLPIEYLTGTITNGQLWSLGIFGSASIIAIGLSWNNQPRAAAWVFLTGLALVIGFFVSTTSGLGLVAAIGIVALLISISITMQMSHQDIVRVTIFAVILGLAVLLYDFYGPSRPALPNSVNRYIPIVSYIEIAVYLFYSLRDFRNYPLRYKLLTVLVLITLIPLGIFIYIGSARTTRILTETAQTTLASAARETAVTLDTFIRNGLTDVSTLSGLHILGEYLVLSPDERPGSETEQVLYQDLQAIARQNVTYITSVGLMDTNGENIADTEPSQIGEFEEEKEFFVKALQTGEPYVSPVELDEGDLSLYFSAPIRGLNNDVIGVLRIRYDASILQALLLESAEANNTEGVVLDLLDENHIFLAITDEPDEILQTVVPLPAQKLTQLQAEGRLPEGAADSMSVNQPDLEIGLNQAAQNPFYTLDSENEYVAFAPLENQPWVIVAGQAQEVFLSPVNSQLKTNILIALIIASVAALSSSVLAQLISQPILNLTRVAEHVTGGDLTVKAKVEADDEIGRLATAFNEMTQQLKNILSNLEKRVADRTQALAATVTIGQNLSSLLNQNEIIQEVVGQLQKEFGYYHVHIYLFDKTKSTLKMMGGSGMVGKALFNMGHTISAGKGLVGRAAQSNSVVLVSDVSKEPGWLPNSLLPDTKAEIAVPISKGGEVLGVIDVQQNAVNGLTEVDAGLVENVANQVAVALQNAEFFAQVQRNAERQLFLAQVNNKIQNANDMESALKVAVRELGMALNAKQSFVQIKTVQEPEQN